VSYSSQGWVTLLLTMQSVKRPASRLAVTVAAAITSPWYAALFVVFQGQLEIE